MIIRSRVADALGDATLARRLLSERNEFGRTFNQELARARATFDRRIRRIMREAVAKEWSRRDVADEVRAQWKRSAELLRVVAWHVARAANLGALSRLAEAGEQFVEVTLSAVHTKTDICDDLAGVFPVRAVRLPPHHPYCKCFIRPVAAARG